MWREVGPHRMNSGATYPSDGTGTWLCCPVDLDLGVPDGSDRCALGGQMVCVEVHVNMCVYRSRTRKLNFL